MKANGNFILQAQPWRPSGSDPGSSHSKNPTPVFLIVTRRCTLMSCATGAEFSLAQVTGDKLVTSIHKLRSCTSRCLRLLSSCSIHKSRAQILSTGPTHTPCPGPYRSQRLSRPPLSYPHAPSIGLVNVSNYSLPPFLYFMCRSNPLVFKQRPPLDGKEEANGMGLLLPISQSRKHWLRMSIGVLFLRRERKSGRRKGKGTLE